MASTGVNVCLLMKCPVSPALAERPSFGLERSDLLISRHSVFEAIIITRIYMLTLLSQVLRYSALAVGVFYGLYHQATISSATKIAQEKREYTHKESLIQKAKEEYTKKTSPQKDDSTLKVVFLAG
jgi:hypothetical protein